MNDFKLSRQLDRRQRVTSQKSAKTTHKGIDAKPRPLFIASTSQNKESGTFNKRL